MSFLTFLLSRQCFFRFFYLNESASRFPNIFSWLMSGRRTFLEQSRSSPSLLVPTIGRTHHHSVNIRLAMKKFHSLSSQELLRQTGCFLNHKNINLFKTKGHPSRILPIFKIWTSFSNPLPRVALEPWVLWTIKEK